MATYASNYEVSAIIAQFDNDHLGLPILYASRTLVDAERKYSAFEHESISAVSEL